VEDNLLPFVATFVMDLIYLILVVAATMGIGLVVFLIYAKKSQVKQRMICPDCYKTVSTDESGNWVCKCGSVLKMKPSRYTQFASMAGRLSNRGSTNAMNNRRK